MNALFVQDNKSMTRLICSILHRGSFTSLVAESGAEVFEDDQQPHFLAAHVFSGAAIVNQ